MDKEFAVGNVIQFEYDSSPIRTSYKIIKILKGAHGKQLWHIKASGGIAYYKQLIDLKKVIKVTQEKKQQHPLTSVFK